jgi:hypothetical protein
MKIIIDSEEIQIPQAEQATTFMEACKSIAAWLLLRQRSIKLCEIDGKALHSLEEADLAYKTGKQLEVASLPLLSAIQDALTLNLNQLRVLESKCENLVTDALLAEPEDIAQQWENLCTSLREMLKFIPQIAYLLTEEELNHLTDETYLNLTKIMQDISEYLPKADVVMFSDILELRLLPWLKSLREFTENVGKQFEANQTVAS